MQRNTTILGRVIILTTYGLVGIVFINLALIIYTVGVWSERFQGRLKWWHVGTFFAGLVCDSIGTWCYESDGGQACCNSTSME